VAGASLAPAAVAGASLAPAAAARASLAPPAVARASLAAAAIADEGRLAPDLVAVGGMASADDFARGLDVLAGQSAAGDHRAAAGDELLQPGPGALLQVRQLGQYDHVVVRFADPQRACLDACRREEQRVEVVVRPLGRDQLAHQRGPLR